MILTSRDFTIVNGELVLLNSRGFSLVFFHAPNCAYCDDFIPTFQTLSNSVVGCNFHSCDMNREEDLKNRSSYTKTPITYVPLVLLFFNEKIINQFFPDEENPGNNTSLLYKFLQDATTQHRVVAAPNNQYGIPYNLQLNKPKNRVCKLSDMYAKMTYPSSKR